MTSLTISSSYRFIDVFNQQSLKFVEIIKAKYAPGEVFDITPMISKLTLDIICGMRLHFYKYYHHYAQFCDFLKVIQQ